MPKEITEKGYTLSALQIVAKNDGNFFTSRHRNMAREETDPVLSRRDSTELDSGVASLGSVERHKLGQFSHLLVHKHDGVAVRLEARTQAWAALKTRRPHNIQEFKGQMPFFHDTRRQY